MRRSQWILVVGLGLGLVGCSSDMRLHTHTFVAATTCGQGPYDIHLAADGTTGEEGVEVIACTPRRISGHVVFEASSYQLANQTFGDVADNQRCLAGSPTITTTAAASASPAASGGGGGDGAATAGAPALIEQPYAGDEDPFEDEVCGRLGLTAQRVLMQTVLERTTDLLPPGADLHVRVWSDAPNDLEHVVFLVRHVTSNKSPAQVAREQAKRDREQKDDHSAPVPLVAPPTHGAPPAPLAEVQPRQPRGAATWIPGYWTWTGEAWGWVAGFWRDAEVAMPAPRAEVPGAPPIPDAIWIGGTWEVRAGAFVWVGGRWRR